MFGRLRVVGGGANHRTRGAYAPRAWMGVSDQSAAGAGKHTRIKLICILKNLCEVPGMLGGGFVH